MNVRYRGRLTPDYEGDELACEDAVRGHALATAQDRELRQIVFAGLLPKRRSGGGIVLTALRASPGRPAAGIWGSAGLRQEL